MIAETLLYIKEQIGLDLELCDCFTGIQKHLGETYFNVVLKKRTFHSEEFDLLKRFAEHSTKIIKVEPNGLNRVAIFINGGLMIQRSTDIQYSIWRDVFTGLHHTILLGGEFSNCHGKGSTPEDAVSSLYLRVNQLRRANRTIAVLN